MASYEALLAANVPECGSDIVQMFEGDVATACGTDVGGTFYMLQEESFDPSFCGDTRCRSFIKLLANSTTTELPAVTDPPPELPAEALSAVTSPTAALKDTEVASESQAPVYAPPPATGSSKTVVTLVIIGSLAIIVLAVLIVLIRRERKKRESNRQTSTHTVAKDHGTYTAYSDSDATTAEDTLSSSSTFPASHVLLPYRIPYSQIELGEVISHGGYGEVLRGAYNHKFVAIKRLLPSRSNDALSIRSFVNEIHLTASLRHECIVRFIGAAWNGPTSLCMVSEFMDGGDLRSLLAEYAKTGHKHGHDDVKLRIAVQVAHAMTYLHSLDPPVVHRDLKSRNILLTGIGNAKIIDFGVSCERQDVTMTAGVGTSLWMAPEVMLGEYYDEKADVFSFGVILSELDTHELPYDHARDAMSGRPTSSMVLMQMIALGRLKPRFTRSARRAIVTLARDCVEVDPSLRPTAVELLHRIDECLAHDETVTDQTRSALFRSLLSARARATTLRSATSPIQSVSRSSTSVPTSTRATTRESRRARPIRLGSVLE